MEGFLELFTKIERSINGFVWGPIMLVLLVGTGVFLTFRTGWIQVRWFGYIMKNTVGSLFSKSGKKDHGSNLSPFQAVTTALAGTVGTGNIAGVTGAIFMGGPGGAGQPGQMSGRKWGNRGGGARRPGRRGSPASALMLPVREALSGRE